MARRERYGKIGGQFAARRIDMLESPAYRALSLSARRVLDRLEIELAHHGGADNGKLPCTYKDFENYCIEYKSIAPEIREAVALGFVEITERGCAGIAEYRSATKYRLTYRPSKYHAGDGTHEWQNIGTLDEALLIARAARNSVMPGRASPIKKARNPVGENPDFSGGNPPRNARTTRGEIPTTAQRGEIPSTLDISGTASKAASLAKDFGQALASAPEGSAVAKPARLHEQPVQVTGRPQDDRARLYAEIATKSRAVGSRIAAGPAKGDGSDKFASRTQSSAPQRSPSHPPDCPSSRGAGLRL